MIVKFDHISYSCSIDEKEFVYSQFEKQYKILFEEVHLKNIEGKQKLFYQYHKYHDLIMLLSEQFLPIEITAYESCKKERERIFIEQNRIVIETVQKEETEAFFREFGFNQQENFMVLKPVLDKQEVILEIRENMQKYNSKLDVYGFTSLAFWSNNINKEKERLQAARYEVTPIEDIVINKKRLKICFAIGKQQEIIELIGIK